LAATKSSVPLSSEAGLFVPPPLSRIWGPNARHVPAFRIDTPSIVLPAGKIGYVELPTVTMCFVSGPGVMAASRLGLTGK